MKINVYLLIGVFVSLSFVYLKDNQPKKGYDSLNLDQSVLPCDNFYQFSVGGWMKNNPIPNTESRWGAFNILQKENEKKLKTILDKLLNDDAKYSKGSDEQLLKAFYQSALDTQTTNQLGLKPILNEWKKIDVLRNIKDIGVLLANQKQRGFGNLFGFYVSIDAKNSQRNIVYMGQGGLSLPDVDYYTKEDEKSKNIRKEYVNHIQNMFALTKETKSIEGYGNLILNIETDLAKISMTRTERRDPVKTYNLYQYNQFVKDFDYIDWGIFFKTVSQTSINEMVISQPQFFEKLGGLLKKYTLNDWKTYMKWHVLSSKAGILSKDFQNESFRFNSTVLKGTTQMKPISERSVNMVNAYLGETLGKAFVKQHFSEASKKEVSQMVENLRAVFKERIQNLDWMNDSTKAKAIAKLDAFTYKIGYTEKWKDYSKAKIEYNKLYDNIISISEISFGMMMSKLGKPIDKTEWGMTPQTVNAYYNSSRNEIVFPAGILQAPFYSPDADDALNYGGIGAVIGHEFSHGFDDKGSKYDKDGNLKNWWSSEDRVKFEQKTKKIVEQFNRFEVLDSVFINGSMTQGENIADFAGLTLSYYALKKQYQQSPPNGIELDGFTWQQRFFLGWSLVWAQNISEKELRNRIITDPHSPGMYRVLGPLSNMPEFWEAFSCDNETKMKAKPNELVNIW
ncbi:MAG: M13 family metallopeptidase [Bacteroidota bacterium]|nr:M13 family metallopeptidase [Bacteroidota bacterium]